MINQSRISIEMKQPYSSPPKQHQPLFTEQKIKPVPSEQFLREYEKKYNMREYDIISNNVYERPGYRPLMEKSIFRSVANICFREDDGKQNRNLINRYKLLNNGKVSENLFNEYVSGKNVKSQFIY